MMVAVRAVLWVVALLLWGVSVVLAVMCGLEIGNGRSAFYNPHGPWLPMNFAGVFGMTALAKPLSAIVISDSSLTFMGTIGAVCLWLLLTVFNVNAIVAVLLAHVPLTYGFAWLSLVVLMFELVCGYLPAFMFMTCAPPQLEAVGAQATCPAPHTVVALPPSPQAAPRKPSSFQDLIRLCQQPECARFPGVTLEADGSLRAGQRAFALALGVSTGAGHARLWREHRDGRIIVTPGQHGTRIALRGREATPTPQTGALPPDTMPPSPKHL